MRSPRTNGQAVLQLQGTKSGTNTLSKRSSGANSQLLAAFTACNAPLNCRERSRAASAIHSPGNLPEVDASHVFYFGHVYFGSTKTFLLTLQTRLQAHGSSPHFYFFLCCFPVFAPITI